MRRYRGPSAIHVPEAERQDVADHDVVRRHRAAAVLHPDDVDDGVPISASALEADFEIRNGCSTTDDDTRLESFGVGAWSLAAAIVFGIAVSDGVAGSTVARKLICPCTPGGRSDPPGDRARPGS